MRVKKKRSVASSNKDIGVDKSVKTDLTAAEEESTKVKAIANCDFIEYSEVEEQDGEDGKPRH